MDRSARAKKPNKAASALESLRAIKAGEAKAIDTFELEDEDAEYEDDAAADREYEEASPEEQCPKKRKHESGADRIHSMLSTVTEHPRRLFRHLLH